MTAAILEIRDGVAVGPLHHPAPKRPLAGSGGFHFSAFATPPLEWTTLCGEVGYVYQREPLAELGHTVECAECNIIANTPPEPAKPKRPIYSPGPARYETESERQEARRSTWRGSYRRGRSRRGVCADCGGPTSLKSVKRCRPCHDAANKAQHGTRSCYVRGCRRPECREAQMEYQRQRRAA